MEASSRCVFDTNVLISALLFPGSKPGRAFFAVLDQAHILVSLPVLLELRDVLGRARFDRYVHPEERAKLLGTLAREAILIETTEEIQVCRDASDNKLLELAVSGGASCIVTGDKDLLALNPFRGISVVTPADFLHTLPAG